MGENTHFAFLTFFTSTIISSEIWLFILNSNIIYFSFKP